MSLCQIVRVGKENPRNEILSRLEEEGIKFPFSVDGKTIHYVDSSHYYSTSPYNKNLYHNPEEAAKVLNYFQYSSGLLSPEQYSEFSRIRDRYNSISAEIMSKEFEKYFPAKALRELASNLNNIYTDKGSSLNDSMNKIAIIMNMLESVTGNDLSIVYGAPPFMDTTETVDKGDEKSIERYNEYYTRDGRLSKPYSNLQN